MAIDGVADRRLRVSARPTEAVALRKACRAFKACLLFTALVARPSAANEIGPTAEQLTERTLGVSALWDSLIERSAGLKIRLAEDLVSSGEFNGASTLWWRTAIGIQAGAPLTDKINIGISPGFAWERLDVNGNDDFVISRAGRDVRLDDFYDSSLRIGANYEWNEKWGGEFITSFSARHESGADYFNSSQAGGSIAVTYRRGSWLRLRLGVGMGADIADSQFRISPVYRIVIKPAPGWSIESNGLGGTIEWDATRKTTFSLGGKVEGNQYRLDRRAEVGDATLQRRQARVDLGTVYRWNKHLRIRGRLGVVLNEEISLVDDDGEESDERENKDPSVIFGITLDIRI